MDKIKENFNLMTIILVMVVGGGAFFGGTKYQQSKTLSQRTQIAGQFGNRAGGTGIGGTGVGRTGGIRGSGQVIGTILSQDGKSITVSMTDGSSKIVLISDSASINQAIVATINDLKVGDRVSVFGTTNADGSVTAQNIQINPIMRNVTPTGTINK